MKIKTAAAACALGFACIAAFAQPSFAASATASFAERLNPDNGIFARGAFAPGRTGLVIANVDDFWSFARAEDWHTSLGRWKRDDTASFEMLARANDPNAGMHHPLRDAVVVDASVVSAVPEPSTYLMLVAGFGAIAYAARRRLHR